MPADGIVSLDNGMYKIWFARQYKTLMGNGRPLTNAAVLFIPRCSWSNGVLFSHWRPTSSWNGLCRFFQYCQKLQWGAALTLLLDNALATMGAGLPSCMAAGPGPPSEPLRHPPPSCSGHFPLSLYFFLISGTVASGRQIGASRTCVHRGLWRRRIHDEQPGDRDRSEVWTANLRSRKPPVGSPRFNGFHRRS